ncbi:MAG: hypothetical protein JW717_06690 [Marinilabiliaceae bacterium]|nr:hypothetical protein [Marinilabiliaceae bacterium]
MKEGVINLLDLDFEYKIWKNRLALFIKEVEILRLRNTEIETTNQNGKLNTVELMVLDEHQDQLMKLLNRIKTQEQEIQFYNKDFPITKDHTYYIEHNKLRSKMDITTKLHFEKITDLIIELGV